MAKDFNPNSVAHQAILNRFEGEAAVISFSGQEIELPKDILPKSSKEGDVLVFTIEQDVFHREEREKKARQILKELLNSK